MSREDVARAALRSLGGSRDGYDTSYDSHEQMSDRLSVGPSYLRHLSPSAKAGSPSWQSERQRTRSGDDGAYFTSSPRQSAEPSRTESMESSERSSEARRDAQSFFSSEARATTMTASPTTSPSLVPIRSPALAGPSAQHGAAKPPYGDGAAPCLVYGTDAPRGRPRPQRRGPAVSSARRDGTPGPYDMPSLCSSSSSGNDGLGMAGDVRGGLADMSGLPRTPSHEIGPIFRDYPGSTSSMQTERAGSGSNRTEGEDRSSRPYTGMASREARRKIEAIRRVATTLHIAPDEITRALDVMSEQRSTEDAMEGLETVTRRPDTSLKSPELEHARRLADAVSFEQDRLTHQDAQRAAYTQAERSRTDMALATGHAAREPSHNRYNPYSPHRRREADLAPANVHSRTMPPLSPPPPYEQHDRMALRDVASPSLPHAQRQRIPSARMALESLGGGQYSGLASPRTSEQIWSPFPHHPRSQLLAQRGPASPLHEQAPDLRGLSARPLALPDRSYRSMDDYGAGGPMSPGLYQPNALDPASSPLRPEFGSAAHTSRPTVPRSPFASSHEHLNGGDGTRLGHSASLRDIASSKRSAATSKGPGSRAPKRRATDDDVMDVGAMRPSSPAPMAVLHDEPEDIGPLPQVQAPSSGKAQRTTRNGRGKSSTMPVNPPALKLNHDEVMARLQQKVKERMAARNRAAAAKAGKAPSPTSLPENGSDGKLAGANNGAAAPASAIAKAATPSQEPAVASTLNPSPRGKTSSFKISTSAKADSPAVQSPTLGHDAAAGRLGIEALLSAAAIADSPRAE